MLTTNRTPQLSRRALGPLLTIVSGWLALSCGPCLAGVPQVSSLEVTDLTPASFAVTWQSSEAATGSLYLFQADCTTPIPNPVLASQSGDTTGLIRVTVSELAADTGYCYQTATTSSYSSDVALFPPQPVAVRTEKNVSRDLVRDTGLVPFANDLVELPAPYLALAGETQAGTLVLLRALDGKGHRPLSLLLTGDASGNFLNLNNLFDPVSGASANLSGGERVRISERHGLGRCAALDRFRLVPADQEQTRAVGLARCSRPQDLDCNGRVNILDVLRVARGSGSSQGDTCFNSDLDLNGDGKVDQLDLEAVKGGFDATP